MPNIDDILMYGAGGLFIGIGYYFFKTQVSTGDKPPSNGDTEPDDGDIPTTGGYVYYAKKKTQCRDNHLTADYLRGQGVRVINYKLFNDGKIYPQVCGHPGPLWVLVAIPIGDAQSGSVLAGLGFEQYTPMPQELNPAVPLPPPAQSNRALAYVGQEGPFRARRMYPF